MRKLVAAQGLTPPSHGMINDRGTRLRRENRLGYISQFLEAVPLRDQSCNWYMLPVTGRSVFIPNRVKPPAANFFPSVHHHDGKPAKNDGYLARAGVAETVEASEEHFDPLDADFLPKESRVDASGSFKKMESIGRRTRQKPKLLGGEAKWEEH
ncbi:hypothetical protein C8J56DRAFT_906286 [Mycena floridula]|nr:hypothetical protein C8J56DRAFT_906286 [Mycena floridula]